MTPVTLQDDSSVESFFNVVETETLALFLRSSQRVVRTDA